MLYALASLLCIGLSLGLPLLIAAMLWRYEYPKAAKILLGGSLTWIALCSGLALSGILNDFSSLPPRPFFVILPPLVLSLLITFHPTTARLLKQIKPQYLIAFQSFRIPVEIFIWLYYLAGVVPIQMSFEGRNWDVVTGITAVLLAIWVDRQPGLPRRAIILWNLLGLGLLVNIVGVSVLSMPTPMRYFMNEPANTLVAQFPFVLLPTVLVVLAYSFHFLSLRQMALLKPQDA